MARYGHEDCLVVLKSIGYATNRDAEFVRRFFLGISSYSRRYGT